MSICFRGCSSCANKSEPRSSLRSEVGADAGGGKRAGRRLDHERTGMAQASDDALPRRQHLGRGRGAIDLFDPLRLIGQQRSRSTSVALATASACRRASRGSAAASGRAAASSSRSVSTSTNARFVSPTCGTRARSRSRPDAARGRREPARRQLPRHGAATGCGGSRDRRRAPRAVAHRVRDRRDAHGRVDSGVEPRQVTERRGHQPAAVDDADDVAVALDAIDVGHRPAQPLGRAPVQLPHVVVGRVVADRLEVGAEAERAARAPALVAEAARPHREREPARRRQVGVDDDLVRLPRPMVPAAEAERAGHARSCRRQDVPAPPETDELRLELAIRLGRLDGDIRHARLAQPERRPSAVACRLSGARTPRESVAGTSRTTVGGRLPA